MYVYVYIYIMVNVDENYTIQNTSRYIHIRINST